MLSYLATDEFSVPCLNTFEGVDIDVIFRLSKATCCTDHDC